MLAMVFKRSFVCAVHIARMHVCLWFSFMNKYKGNAIENVVCEMLAMWPEFTYLRTCIFEGECKRQTKVRLECR